VRQWLKKQVLYKALYIYTWACLQVANIVKTTLFLLLVCPTFKF
jgi:hypothetical protein